MTLFQCNYPIRLSSKHPSVTYSTKRLTADGDKVNKRAKRRSYSYRSSNLRLALPSEEQRRINWRWCPNRRRHLRNRHKEPVNVITMNYHMRSIKKLCDLESLI
ncbi:hypothetical protein QR680_018645 [Steinernema hermaphroditum]|uniref:Uncharacterized protein n=1 Tax=Steinernema hermaphroditum TaxID=289476 RepID=A0AA39HJW6_9BILA|nr:hypothetical protein QR680_018645 [Steinernema hermaphroditum]